MNTIPDRVMLEISHEHFLDHLRGFYPAMLKDGQMHEIMRQLFDKMKADFRTYVAEVQFLPNRDFLEIQHFTMEQVNQLCEAIVVIGIGLYGIVNQHRLFQHSEADTFPYFLEHVNIGVACTYVYLHADHQVQQPFFVNGR